MKEGEESGSAGSERLNEDWRENPYVIEIKEGTPMEKLNELKGVLLRSQGERQVEIHLKNAKGVRRIKLSFGVRIDEVMEKEVKNLLEK